MTNKIGTERRAGAEFFKNANPQDDYSVISLADRPRLIADTTQSLEEIEHKLALVIPDGHTALLDAIYQGVCKMRSARYQRRALLIISDGGDNHSHYTGKEARSMVQESDVLVYGIGIFDTLPMPVFQPLDERLGERLPGEITTASGGAQFPRPSGKRFPKSPPRSAGSCASNMCWDTNRAKVCTTKMAKHQGARKCLCGRPASTSTLQARILGSGEVGYSRS